MTQDRTNLQRDAGATARRTNRRALYQTVASLHANSIPGFLPKLGVKFLSAMYQCIDEHPETILITEVESGEVIGFVAGTTGRQSLRSVVLQRPFQLLAALMPSLIVPKRIAGVVAILRYSRPKVHPVTPAVHAELLSMVIRAEYRGQGYAERLFKAFGDRLGQLGVSEFKIVAGTWNPGACRFYEKMGATEVMRFELHKGETSILFRKAIPTHTMGVQA